MRIRTIAIAAALAIASGAVVCVVGALPSGQQDMTGHSVSADPEPIGAVVASANTPGRTPPAPAPAGRFSVPSVELNVPLGATSDIGGEIVPPGFASAYYVQNLGVSPANAASGTVYVVMHSVRGGGTGPGNYLVDEATASSRVPDGTQIVAGSNTYTVTGSAEIAKTRLPEDANVWNSSPGRLIVITCIEKPDDSLSTNNLVITAQLDH
jgi:hypothetical protein